MSVAKIFESIRRDAEKTDSSEGTSALLQARYYGLHPQVTRLIELVVGWNDQTGDCRHVCECILTNPNDSLHSPFWRAIANLYLGLLPDGLTPKSRDEYFAAAEGNLWRVAVDKDGEDAAYINRRMCIDKLDDMPLTESDWESRLDLMKIMIIHGDFDTPGVVQRYLVGTHPGEGYVEPGPGTLNFITKCLARVNGPNCYYSKVQLATLKEYVKKKFGI